MNAWSDYIKALGQDEHCSMIMGLWRKLKESPIILETPSDYNDPDGKTRFYKFIETGLEFGFRSERLNHIHFFIQPHEGYSAYSADVLGRPARKWTVQEAVKELGPADKSAPARIDMLIGPVQQWAKYEFPTNDLRMEFSDDGRLWKVTLMVRQQ